MQPEAHYPQGQVDPHKLPAAAWVDLEGWLERSGWDTSDTSALDTSGQITGKVENLAEDDEVLEDAEEATEPQEEGADQIGAEEASAEGAAPSGATSTRKRGPPDSGGDLSSDSCDADVPLAPSEPSVPKFVSVPTGFS